MALFVVRHQHDEATCPAKDPVKGAMLLEHLKPSNARKFGVTIKGDGVLNGKHTFFMISEAEEPQFVENFVQAFRQAGPVEIWPASDCESVIARGGC
jgi:hypothetical protein